MAPLVSIIIPVYNAAKHLEECLDSVVAQTLPHGCFEVIVVDDKSSDGSVKIAKNYERLYTNVRVIALPERTPGGPGLPSNIGIKVAAGKYVAFLDHDDIACPTMLEKAVAEAEAEDADLTFFSFNMCPVGTTESYDPYDLEYWKKIFEPGFTGLSLEEQKKSYLKLAPAPWRKIYNADYLRRNNILFPVADFFFEDMAFHWRTILPAEKLARIDERLVFYKTELPDQTTGMPIEKAIVHQIYQLGDIKAFLLRKDLWGVFHADFAYCTAELFKLIPETHPMHNDVKNAMADLVETTAI